AVGAEIRRQAEIARQKEIARLLEIERKKQEAAAGGGGGTSSSGWTRPSYGYASSSYGPRVPPTPGASSYHYGTDFGASCGSAIVAASAGRVIYAGWNGSGYGNFVKIDHGGGVTTGYAHIQGG